MAKRGLDNMREAPYTLIHHLRHCAVTEWTTGNSAWDGLGYSVMIHTMTLNGMDWDTLLWFILWLWMGYSVVTHTMTAFTIWSNSEYCVFKQLLHSKWSTLKCENKMCHPISSVLWNSRCALPCGVSTEAHAEVNGSDDESQQKHEVEQHRGAVGADHLLCWNTTPQDTTLKRGGERNSKRKQNE